jgi:hypothetical protein
LPALVYTARQPRLLFESKCPFFYECGPHREKVRSIDGEHVNPYSADCGSAGEFGSCPFEMLRPAVVSWMEEPNEVAGSLISSSDVRTFAPVAMEASQGEILKRS